MDWLDRKHQKTTWNQWSSHEMKVSFTPSQWHHNIKHTATTGDTFQHRCPKSTTGHPFSAFQSPPDRWSSWKKAHWPCNIFLLGVYSPLRSKLAMRGSDLPRLLHMQVSIWYFFLFSLSLSLSSILNCSSLHELPDTINMRSNLQVQFPKYSTTNTHNASMV